MRTVPQSVGDVHEPQGPPPRGAAGDRRHRAARRRRVRPGDPGAGGLAGLGRAAGGGDGAGRRAGGRRAPHRQRAGARRPRRRARRGRARVRRPAGRQGARGGADRARARPALRRLRAARDGADRGDADRAADRRERPLQDPRGDPVDRPARAPVGPPVVLLAGGTGGAKLARGMLDEVGEDLVVVANTGDDIEIYGAYVSPDPDLVMFWLADRIDARGWGLAGDTFHVMEGLRELGEDVWMQLGDRDLALCLLRARGGWFAFQPFMIRERAAGPVEDVALHGIGAARATPEVLEAVAAARAIVIGPSNPVISIGPILAVPGVRDAVRAARAPVVAVSPLVRGQVLKGPTDQFLAWAGHPMSSDGIAAHYEGLLDGLVADELILDVTGPAQAEPIIAELFA